MKIIVIGEGFPKHSEKIQFLNGWGTRFARNLIKHRPDLEIECWNYYNPKHYPNLGRYQEFEGGIKLVQFPANKIFGKYTSLEMLNELNVRIKSGEKIIVHLQRVHTILTYMISVICRNTPLLCQQRGPDSPPMWRFKFYPHPGFFFLSIMNHVSLKNIDHVFASAIGSVRYLKHKIGSDRVEHLKGGGFRFDSFKVKSKSELRKELSLPLDKKLMIHVGRFVKSSVDKGIPIIIQVSETLKNKSDEFEFVFIGGNEKQELYNDIVSTGAITIGRIPVADVRKYINACDIYLLPTVDKRLIPYADVASAMVEAWAFNIPVVSPLLIHFLGNVEEQKKLGLKTKNKDDVLKAIKFILNNYNYFNKTRSIVKKYYNWNSILKRNTDVYDRYYNKYYVDK